MYKSKSSKWAVALLVAVMLLGIVGGIPGASAELDGQGEVSVSPEEVSLEEGETETIDVEYEVVTGDTPQAVAYTIEYDPDVVEVTGQNTGSFLDAGANESEISNDDGVVSYVEIKDQEVDEDENVATITVEPTCGISGGDTTEFEFTSVDVAEEQDVNVKTVDGEIEVKGSTPPCNGGSDDDEGSDDSSGSDDSDAGGGGAGGAGGSGGGGGEGGEGPPTADQVRSTLSLVDGTSDTTTQIEAGADGNGPTVTADETDTVKEITFNNEEASGTVEIEEYDRIPSTIEEETTESIDASVDDISDDELELVSMAEIETSMSTREDTSSTTTLEVDVDDVDNPEQLTVIKDRWSVDQQQYIWEQKPTEVTEQGDVLEIETEFDSFSIVVLAEVEGDAGTAAIDDPGGQEVGDGGFEVSGSTVAVAAAALALLGAVVFTYRRRGGETEMYDGKETVDKADTTVSAGKSTETTGGKRPEMVVREYFSALETADVEQINAKIHSQAESEKISEEGAAKLSDQAFGFEVASTEVDKKSDDEAVVAGTGQLTIQSETDVDSFEFTLRRDNGEWKIYDSG